MLNANTTFGCDVGSSSRLDGQLAYIGGTGRETRRFAGTAMVSITHFADQARLIYYCLRWKGDCAGPDIGVTNPD